MNREFPNSTVPMFSKKPEECEHKLYEEEYSRLDGMYWRRCRECGELFDDSPAVNNTIVLARGLPVFDADYYGIPITSEDAENRLRCPECGKLVLVAYTHEAFFTISHMGDGEGNDYNICELYELEESLEQKHWFQCSHCDAKWDTIDDYYEACDEQRERAACKLIDKDKLLEQLQGFALSCSELSQDQTKQKKVRRRALASAETAKTIMRRINAGDYDA